MDARNNNHLTSNTSNEMNPHLYDSHQPSVFDYDSIIRKQLQQTLPPSLTQVNFIPQPAKPQLWDPKTMLGNLSVMEDKIHQLRELVHLILAKSSVDQRQTDQLLIQQQQLVTADLTSIIIQLISTAGSLLPSVNHFPNANPSVGNGVNVSDNNCNGNGNANGDDNDNYHSDSNALRNMVSKVEEHPTETDHVDHMDVHEDHDDDVEEGEHLPAGSYEILQLEKEEILAPHTHFCVICGKGFKRDANLRMHMRGHGDEYKTPAALAKPHKETGSEAKLVKRYSCPFVGCKRNKDHKKFQPLKTILCVKNHYKRSHCDKSFTCSRCNTKKFSVIADLKTHEKHCGRDRWLCSCGTTFSRKDKLFGHISLFQGHTPAIPLDEPKVGLLHDQDDNNNNNSNNTNTNTNTNTNNNTINNIEGSKEVGFFDFNFNSNVTSGSGVVGEPSGTGLVGEPSACFSPFQDFSRNMFDESDSLSFLLSGSCNYMWKNGGESSSKDQ